MGFFHCNVIDSTMHRILLRLLLLIVVALGLCLALLLLGTLVGKVPKVATTKTWVDVARSLTSAILLLGLVVVGSLLQKVGVRLLLLLLRWLHWRLVRPNNLIRHLLWWPLLLILPSMAEHWTCGWGIKKGMVVAA